MPKRLPPEGRVMEKEAEELKAAAEAADDPKFQKR